MMSMHDADPITRAVRFITEAAGLAALLAVLYAWSWGRGVVGWGDSDER